MGSFLKNYGPALVSGLLLAMAFPALHWYLVMWFALIPLLLHGRHASPRESALQFFLAGWVFNSLVLHWLLSNIYWAGAWAILAYQALSLFMAAYWALLGFLYALCRRTLKPLPAALVLALLWMTMETLQASLFSGFGWCALGYAQGKNLPLLQWAALGGVSLISAAVVAVNACLAEAIGAHGRQRVFSLLCAAGLFVLLHVGGYALLREADYGGKPFRVGLVQPDFPQEMKWDEEYQVEMVRNAAEKSRILATVDGCDLFVWPESLVSSPIDTGAILQIIQETTGATRTPLFTGAIRIDPETDGVRNSSYYFTAQGEIEGFYDKMHLAPFGEYVPFGDYFPFIEQFVPAIGGVEAGDEPEVFPVGSRTLGPLICFEVLFTEMAMDLKRQGADFIVVITNLSWFGASGAIPQELEIARLRAVETRLPLVHCANTGITGVFDPYGRFEGINGRINAFGDYRHYDVEPEMTIMGRFLGVLPVAKPAPHALPWGPRWLPWIVTVLAGLLVGVAAWRSRASSSLAHTRETRP